MLDGIMGCLTINQDLDCIASDGPCNPKGSLVHSLEKAWRLMRLASCCASSTISLSAGDMFTSRPFESKLVRSKN